MTQQQDDFRLEVGEGVPPEIGEKLVAYAKAKDAEDSPTAYSVYTTKSMIVKHDAKKKLFIAVSKQKWEGVEDKGRGGMKGVSAVYTNTDTLPDDGNGEPKRISHEKF